MNKRELLKNDYKAIEQMGIEYYRKLVEFIQAGIEFCSGVVELPVKYKSYKEATKNDENFTDQFPVCIDIEDRHDWIHSIHITKVYCKHNNFYVDGWDESDNKWVEGWMPDGSASTTEELASFVDYVINPEVDEEETETDKDDNFTSELIGYRLIDKDGCFPSTLGCWDAFLTEQDAKGYQEELKKFDPTEYKIEEIWSTKFKEKTMFRFHEIIQRTSIKVTSFG